MHISFFYKNNFFNFVNCLLFFSRKFSTLKKIPWFFPFSSSSFPSFSFSSLFPPSPLPHEQRTERRWEAGPSPQRPSNGPHAPPNSAPLSSFPFPLPSLSGWAPMAAHGAWYRPWPPPSWKASTKAIFLHGTTEMDAHDLPLAIHALNFI
jgi:hypothetical protein